MWQIQNAFTNGRQCEIIDYHFSKRYLYLGGEFMKRMSFRKKLGLRERIQVEDGQGNLLYQVMGKTLSLGKKAIILNAADEEAASIQERLITQSQRQMELVIQDNVTATITQHPGSGKFEYQVVPDNIQIIGDTWGMNFQITKNDLSIGNISRDMWSLLGKFEVEIQDEICELLVIGIVMTIALENGFATGLQKCGVC